MEFFVHPWYMAAGGALISSPILIHLINRMRFKRIRWAAMEFLLKSQKRNRRRLIIEQMILLLLRILLVLLAAFLVARFLFAGTGTKGATHIVIVDDTLSMMDRGKEEGGAEEVAYDVAIEQIKEVVRAAAQAPSAQQMRVYLLSEMDKDPLWQGRLSDASATEIEGKFIARKKQPTLLHLSPLPAIKQARKYLVDLKGDVGQKNLHFISDFRDTDWTTGGDAEKLVSEVKGVLEDGINLNLIDTASPRRTQKDKGVNQHDNLAILDIRPEARVVVEGQDVSFTVQVMNYSPGKGKAFMKVFVNDEQILSADQSLNDLAAGRVTEHRFSLRFESKKGGKEVDATGLPLSQLEPLLRQQREFFHVRVKLGREDSGLNVDNVRDLVVEVRKRVPTLVVDGTRPENKGDGSDLHHLQAFFKAAGVYDLQERKLAELERADLDLYPSIYLVNVPEIPKPIIDRLKKYLDNGGSICFFLGDEVKADHYNNELFKAGLFPLKISDRPYDPIAARGINDPERRKLEREKQQQQNKQPKILFPVREHPLAQRLWPFSQAFRYLSINVYWKAIERSKWDPEPRRADTPVVLPNAGTIDTYKGRAQNLSEQAEKLTRTLAGKESDFKRYVGPIETYKRQVSNALFSRDLFLLAQALEQMLTDRVKLSKDGDKKEEFARMEDLWKHPDLKNLASEIREFRDQVLYGDPLVVTKRQGKGRVVAYLTTAGTSLRKGVGGEDSVQWNNWGAGEKVVSILYPFFLMDLQRFLVAEGQAPNRVLGEDINFTLDANLYDSKFSWRFKRQPDLENDQDQNEKNIQEEKENDIRMPKSGKVIDFSWKNVRRPGVFFFTFTRLGDGPVESRQEVRAFAYNVDVTRESDLKRATKDRLEPTLPPGDSKRGKLTLRKPGDAYEEFKEKQPDASESPWLYLFFIIILVVEQAMAVHLSFHLKGNESNQPAATAAPAAAA